MAKGQKRSTKEIRKPKQEKVAPKPDAPFGSQIKLAGTTTTAAPRPKGKG